MNKQDLRDAVGEIDIYLFDQVLKGRFDNARRILDVGCGRGRNLVYFLRNDIEVFGIDHAVHDIQQARDLAATIAPKLRPDNFRVGQAEDLPYADGWFDAVICNAVLHFADTVDHFDRMLNSMWRVLRDDGVFFARLASNIGLESQSLTVVGDRRFILPDGTERFLVDERMLMQATKHLEGTLLDPLKTTVVQNKRAMTTWCIKKGGSRHS